MTTEQPRADFLWFSVQSAPGVSVPELAKAGKFKNKKISVTTVKVLEELGARVVDTPGKGYHRTVVVPYPLTEVQAELLSRAFVRMPNPNRFQKGDVNATHLRRLQQ